MSARFTGRDIQNMVRHWLETPCNGYLGSDYGQDSKGLLQKPQNEALANKFIQKLRTDVPILGAVGGDSANLYGVPDEFDKLQIYIEVLGQSIEVTSSGS